MKLNNKTLEFGESLNKKQDGRGIEVGSGSIHIGKLKKGEKDTGSYI